MKQGRILLQTRFSLKSFEDFLVASRTSVSRSHFFSFKLESWNMPDAVVLLFTD